MLTERDGVVGKRCPRCGEWKPCGEFWRDRTSADGYGSRCKKCKDGLDGAKRETVICRECGCTFEHVGRSRAVFCSEVCRQRKKTKIPPAEYPAILALYESGNTAAAIAAIYKVTESGILSVLNRLGVKRRHSADYVAMGSDRHPTKGKGHTDAAKAKIRAANQRQFATKEAREQAASRQRAAMASGKIAAVSALEGIVAGVLDSLAIPYQRQAGIRHPTTQQYCACVDFLLANKVVLEVNGTYWHADPRAYPDGPVHASQHKTVNNYTRKVATLRAIGFRVLEVWEADIRRDARAAVLHALRLVNDFNDIA